MRSHAIKKYEYFIFGGYLMENILVVIEELGSLLTKYKDEIKYKDYEIDSLKKKIEQIEQYIDFYSKE